MLSQITGNCFFFSKADCPTDIRRGCSPSGKRHPSFKLFLLWNARALKIRDMRRLPRIGIIITVSHGMWEQTSAYAAVLSASISYAGEVVGADRDRGLHRCVKSQIVRSEGEKMGC